MKENKFVAGLVGFTAVVGGVIFVYGNSQGDAFDEKMLEYEDLKNKHTLLQKSKPYPDAVNLKKRQRGVNQYTDVIDAVRSALVRYQPGKLASLTPEQFSDAQVKVGKMLRADFEAAGTTLPDGCKFGFEKYAKVQAKAGATAQLNYQLGAMQWLLGQLAEVKPEELVNIKRAELPVETAAGTPAPSGRGGRAGSRSRGRASKSGAASEKPYQLMPVELSFTATEASVRDFLKSMVNSEDYFFSIRALRVRNERQTPPTKKDANFPEIRGGGAPFQPAGANPFAGIAFPDDADEGDGQVPAPAPAPAPSVEGQHILKQVLGSEKLHVYISFDILLIKGAAAGAEASSAPSNG